MQWSSLCGGAWLLVATPLPSVSRSISKTKTFPMWSLIFPWSDGILKSNKDNKWIKLCGLAGQESARLFANMAKHSCGFNCFFSPLPFACRSRASQTLLTPSMLIKLPNWCLCASMGGSDYPLFASLGRIDIEVQATSGPEYRKNKRTKTWNFFDHAPFSFFLTLKACEINLYWHLPLTYIEIERVHLPNETHLKST